MLRQRRAEANVRDITHERWKLSTICRGSNLSQSFQPPLQQPMCLSDKYVVEGVSIAKL